MPLLGEVHVCPESSNLRQRLAGVLKFTWYVCASILILSLPTFSYLQPRPGSTGSRVALERGASPGTGSAASTPATLITNFVRGAVAAVTGSSNPPKSANAASPSQSSDLETGRAPQDGVREGSERGSGSILPQRFGRRRVARLEEAVADREPGPSQVEAGLEDLQQGYEQAFNTLFPEVFLGARASGNPFQGALEENAGAGTGTDSGADQGGASAGDDPAPGQQDHATDPGQQPPNNSDPGQPGDSGSGGGGDVSDPPQTEPPFSFLVVGRLPGNVSDAFVSRARLEANGDFALENSYRFSFFPGIFHSILTFEENEKLLMADLDKDGSLDFVVVTEVPAVGTAIESYLQKSPGEFQLGASAFLYLQAVRSFALFDFNRDGQEELAAVLSGNDNLVVFEQAGSEWRYLRELSLSIRPALVMSAAVAPGVRSRQLYVLDNSLQFVLTASDRQPEFFRPGSKAPVNRLRILEANLTGRDGAPTLSLVFNLPDQVVLAEGVGSNLRMFGSFEANPSPPLVIIGDYARKGSRQMLWVP